MGKGRQEKWVVSICGEVLTGTKGIRMLSGRDFHNKVDFVM
jgi:hypothetical protein